MKLLNLRKPPIVEAWVGFRFDPANDTTGWGHPEIENAQVFMQQYEATFPKHAEIFEQRFEVKRGREDTPLKRRTGLPDVLRRSNVSESQFVQVGQDFLSYHLLAPGVDYRGFGSLRTDCLEALRRYNDVFRPKGVLQAEFHVVDVVKLPNGGEETLKFEDFFTVNVSVPPEPFGCVHGFSIQLMLQAATSADEMHIRISRDPAPSRVEVRVHWDQICRNDPPTTEISAIEEKLNVAYNHLNKCFRALFTDRGWGLFEPFED
jgi:uncharacterized protein (TIGR04255 family)